MTFKDLKYWRLPNIRSINIVSWTYHQFLSTLGISKKERQLDIKSSKLNIQHNLLLRHDHRLLINSIGSIDRSRSGYIKSHWNSKYVNNKFFELAREIMLRNKSFMVRHIHRLDLKFARERKVSELRYIIKAAQSKIRKGSLSIPMRRKWLQAPAPKCRSLTIPNKVDRLIASMWTEILELYLRGTIGLGHHGYQNGKGTSSALQDILTLQDNFEHVYEFDLKNFFPSVSHSVLMHILNDLGIPKFMQIYFLLPLQQKPDLDMDLEVHDYATGKPTFIFESIFHKVNHKGESNFVLNKPRNIGVPMGLGYSPLLAMLVLCKVMKDWKNDNNSFVTYADDGLLLTNNLDDIKSFHDICLKYGLKVNEEKSKLVKSEGLRLSYKFLGIIYNPDNTIVSSTRKGTSIALNTFQKVTNIHSTRPYITEFNLKLRKFENSLFTFWQELDPTKPFWNRIPIVRNSENYFKNDYLSSWTTITTRISVSFKELISQQVFPTILARLYSTCDLVDQNFILQFAPKSIVEKLNYRRGLNRALRYNNIRDIRQHLNKLRLWHLGIFTKPFGITQNRLFSTTSLLGVKLSFYNYLKHSNYIYDELIAERELELNVFNQSTVAAKWLVDECSKIAKYNNEKTLSTATLKEIYGIKWDENLSKLEIEKSSLGRTIETTHGPIYESQVGRRNFERITSFVGHNA